MPRCAENAELRKDNAELRAMPPPGLHGRNEIRHAVGSAWLAAHRYRQQHGAPKPSPKGEVIRSTWQPLRAYVASLHLIGTVPCDALPATGNLGFAEFLCKFDVLPEMVRSSVGDLWGRCSLTSVTAV
jgi:hypothetical protein